MEDSKLKLGDLVAIYAVPGCGKSDCSECGRDLAQLCQKGQHHGIGQDGSFADYVAIDQRAAVPLPKGMFELKDSFYAAGKILTTISIIQVFPQLKVLLLPMREQLRTQPSSSELRSRKIKQSSYLDLVDLVSTLCK